MKRKSQKQICLEILQDKKDWLPAHYFVGEKYHRGRFVFLSYKAPARLSDLYNEGKVLRKKVKGQSGAEYYSYRIKSHKL